MDLTSLKPSLAPPRTDEDLQLYAEDVSADHRCPARAARRQAPVLLGKDLVISDPVRKANPASTTA